MRILRKYALFQKHAYSSKNMHVFVIFGQRYGQTDGQTDGRTNPKIHTDEKQVMRPGRKATEGSVN